MNLEKFLRSNSIKPNKTRITIPDKVIKKESKRDRYNRYTKNFKQTKRFCKSLINAKPHKKPLRIVNLLTSEVVSPSNGWESDLIIVDAIKYFEETGNVKYARE